MSTRTAIRPSSRAARVPGLRRFARQHRGQAERSQLKSLEQCGQRMCMAGVPFNTRLVPPSRFVTEKMREFFPAPGPAFPRLEEREQIIQLGGHLVVALDREAHRGAQLLAVFPPQAAERGTQGHRAEAELGG